MGYYRVDCNTKALQKSIQDRQQHKLKTAAFLSVVAGGAAVMQYISPHLIKTPMYDSKLSREAWVQELLNDHPGRFHDNFGMSKHVFQKLVQELQIYAGLDSDVKVQFSSVLHHIFPNPEPDFRVRFRPPLELEPEPRG